MTGSEIGIAACVEMPNGRRIRSNKFAMHAGMLMSLSSTTISLHIHLISVKVFYLDVAQRCCSASYEFPSALENRECGNGGGE